MRRRSKGLEPGLRKPKDARQSVVFLRFWEGEEAKNKAAKK